VKIIRTCLLGDIVERTGRNRIRFRHRYCSNLAGVSVFVSERRVTSFAADRNETVASES